MAVEPSADLIGARLMGALRERLPDVIFCGAGGPHMREAGLASLFDIDALSVLGVTEALRAYRLVLRRAAEIAKLAEQTRPAAAILIDAWGFNLRVARRLKALADPPLVIKYVAPQVWATRPGRARTLARAVDRLLSIHRFDLAYFQREGLPVDFVGNPALPPRHGGEAGPPGARDPGTVLLLPGSRPAEIGRLMPVFGKAAGRLRAGRPDLRFVLAPAEAVALQVQAAAADWPFPVDIAGSEAAKREVMARATVALACSGTVTTELAAGGCPMVVAYRLSSLTYLAARALIRTRWITLINIAAQKTIAPEFIQGRCTAKALAGALARRLDDRMLCAEQTAAQSRAIEILRDGIDDPIRAAADAVIAVLAADQPRISIGA